MLTARALVMNATWANRIAFRQTARQLWQQLLGLPFPKCKCHEKEVRVHNETTDSKEAVKQLYLRYVAPINCIAFHLGRWRPNATADRFPAQKKKKSFKMPSLGRKVRGGPQSPWAQAPAPGAAAAAEAAWLQHFLVSATPFSVLLARAHYT